MSAVCTTRLSACGKKYRRDPTTRVSRSRGQFQNASILAFASPRFCLQSLSFASLRRSPLTSPPSSPPTFLVVPHSFSIPSIVRNLGKFSNPIPLLVIFDRRFLVTPFDPRPETRCNRRARPKEKFRLHSQLLAPTSLCVLFICSYIPLILQVRLYISQSALTTHDPISPLGVDVDHR